MELIEPYITNMQQAWIPLVGAGLIVLAFAFAVATIVSNERISRPRKFFSILASFLWTMFFCGIEALLAWSACKGNITGANPFYLICIACVCAGGLSVLGAKVTTLVSSPLSPSVQTKTPFQKARHLFSSFLSWVLPFLAIGAVTLLCLVFLEQPANPWYVYIVEPYITCEITIIAGFVAGVWLIFQRRPIGLIIPMIVALVYGLAEYFVETFKSAAIMPGDLRSANTGMSVAGGYSYEMTAVILLVIALFALATGVIAWIKDPFRRVLARKEPKHTAHDQEPLTYEQIEKKRTWSYVRYFIKNVIAIAVSVVLGIYLITAPIAAALEVDWEEEGLVFDYWRTHEAIDEFGIIPSFMAALQLEDIKTPDGYTHDEAVELQTGLADLYDQYVEPTPTRQAASAQFAQVKPNVILVMNESFADLSFMGGLGVGYRGPDYLRHMNAIAKGKTFVSVYGGNTCNSEFESLSGSSLGSIAGGINPYSVYDLSLIDSIPKQFKALGYETTAIHPEAATNWDRDKVYPAIGFDQFIAREAFEGAEEVREHVTDTATYEMVLEQLKSSDEPQFVFDLTMMGHGGYETGLIPEDKRLNYDFSNVIEDEEDGAAINEYLASIRMSDEDLQRFIESLHNFNEPTVVVFFGDHQPGLSWLFKDQFADDSNETIFQESMYQTDYFIWANYAVAGSNWNPGTAALGLPYPTIEANAVGTSQAMSPAALMSWTLSYIGAPLSDYEKASYASRWWVQASNLYGFMDSAGVWHSEDEEAAIQGQETFEEGMRIIESYAAQPSNTDQPAEDAVMANVMKWITYLNFAEKLK